MFGECVVGVSMVDTKAQRALQHSFSCRPLQLFETLTTLCPNHAFRVSRTTLCLFIPWGYKATRSFKTHQLTYFLKSPSGSCPTAKRAFPAKENGRVFLRDKPIFPLGRAQAPPAQKVCVCVSLSCLIVQLPPFPLLHPSGLPRASYSHLYHACPPPQTSP